MKRKVSPLQASPRGSLPSSAAWGLPALFRGVEKHISYKELHRQRGTGRNARGGLGGQRVGGRREGGEGGMGRLRAQRLQRKKGEKGGEKLVLSGSPERRPGSSPGSF